MDAQSRRNSGIRRLALARHECERRAERERETRAPAVQPSSTAPCSPAAPSRPVPSRPVHSRPAELRPAEVLELALIHAFINAESVSKTAGPRCRVRSRVESCRVVCAVSFRALRCVSVRLRPNPIQSNSSRVESNRIAVRRRRAVDSVRSSRQTGAQVGALTKSHIFQWRALLRRDATRRDAMRCDVEDGEREMR